MIAQVPCVVYVDSGSTDDSVQQAEQRGVHVVALDLSQPFTAARARNAGFRRLQEIAPETTHVQFVDGDCELREGWIEAALAAFATDPEVVVVCGRRRERFPQETLFNALCDVEWDGLSGEVDSSGGDALMRCDAFAAVEGFNPRLIAGEEPDLCHRLRKQGGKIMRIDAEMTWHDAAMTRVSQWWKRTLRAGHAYAENHWDHRQDGLGFRRRDLRRIVFWGALAPLAILLGAVLVHPALALAALVYPIQAWRIARHLEPRPPRRKDALRYGWSCVLGRLPELCGVVKYHWGRLRGRGSRLIEYK